MKLMIRVCEIRHDDILEYYSRFVKLATHLHSPIRLHGMVLN